jgi:hypothetical protein
VDHHRVRDVVLYRAELRAAGAEEGGESFLRAGE